MPCSFRFAQEFALPLLYPLKKLDFLRCASRLFLYRPNPFRPCLVLASANRKRGTTMTLVALFAPRDPAHPNASPLRELSALRNRQVWLTLGVSAIGFGGMFAIYAFLASTLREVTQVGPDVLPWVFAVFGAGMFTGNILGAWAGDRFGFPAAAGLLIWSAIALAFYPLASQHLWSMMIIVLCVGAGGGLGSILQTRLMDVAGEAQTLAAALNHSAFNTANALGPLLAGMTVAAGLGWASTAWVAVALTLGGLAIWFWAWMDGRRRVAA